MGKMPLPRASGHQGTPTCGTLVVNSNLWSSTSVVHLAIRDGDALGYSHRKRVFPKIKVSSEKLPLLDFSTTQAFC